MTEAQRIATRLFQIIHGEAWHGPAVLELIREITPEQAASIPKGGSNSIWALVLHIGVWIRGVHQRMLGIAFMPTEYENFPPIPTQTPENWQATIDDLKEATQEMVDALNNYPDTALSQPSPTNPNNTIRDNIYGLVEHTAYHAGQIALIKNMK